MSLRRLFLDVRCSQSRLRKACSVAALPLDVRKASGLPSLPQKKKRGWERRRSFPPALPIKGTLFYKHLAPNGASPAIQAATLIARFRIEISGHHPFLFRVLSIAPRCTAHPPRECFVERDSRTLVLRQYPSQQRFQAVVD